MMIGRDRSLAVALEAVRGGSSIDVVGSRGCGRSAFLTELKTSLESAGWRVIVVRGVASLRQYPLAAIHLAGIGSPADSRSLSAIRITADALREQCKNPQTVLFLDDWDDLDEASWGVAESVRRGIRLPIVLSRLKGLHARHTPTGLTASTLEPSFVIELAPMRFEELERVISAHLRGPIEVGTMSRLYARSGGIVGLALHLVDAAAREGRIEQVAGRWSAIRDLWSPGLQGAVEAYMEDLSADARDALEVIALVGAADVETVRKLVSWETLEFLEQRSMVRLIPSGARQLVTVVPPLLVEFFRHEPLAIRRVRLTELIIDRLGTSEPMTLVLEHFSPATDAVGEADALFVRMIQERDRTRHIVTESEWQHSPSPITATAYVRSLLQSNAPATAVAEVVDAVDPTAGDESDRAAFSILRAQWEAYVLKDLDGALAKLQRARAGLGSYARLLDAAAVLIETDLRGVPDDFAARLEMPEYLPTDVRDALRTAQISVLVSLGRFTDARRILGSNVERSAASMGLAPSILHGLVLLGEGDYAGALAWSTRGIDEARGSLDVPATRSHGAIAAFAHSLAGDYTAAQKVLETMFAVRPAVPLPLTVELTLLNVASLVAVRWGRIALAEKYAEELTDLSFPGGMYETQARVWADIHLLIAQGQPDAAADLAWETAGTLWDRGARFLAVILSLLSLEISPNAERTETASARCEQIDDSFVAPHLVFIRARDAQDARRLVTNVDALLSTGRRGIALVSLQLAEELWIEQGDTDSGAAARSRRDILLAEFDQAGIYAARFPGTGIVLTERETQIGQLIASGLTNPEIATKLVVSVRTVESHIYRVLRKTHTTSRQELIDFMHNRP